MFLQYGRLAYADRKNFFYLAYDKHFCDKIFFWLPIIAY